MTIITTSEIKDQAIKAGLNEKAAERMSHELWGYNLTCIIVAHKYNSKRTEVYTYAEHTMTNGSVMGFERICRVSTGSLIRSTKVYYPVQKSYIK